MVKKDKPLTKKEIEQAKLLLKTGRTRYDNAIFEIEKHWGKLKQYDYTIRQNLIDAALSMIEIDQQLKGWESKLSSE